MKPVQYILIFFVRLYQWTLSPMLRLVTGPHAGCRFTPTCSQYALEAIQSHGALGGSWLALKRICRCHPWGGCGHDPVPEKRKAESVHPPQCYGGRGKAETSNVERWDATAHVTRNTQHAATLDSQLSTLNPSPARHGS